MIIFELEYPFCIAVCIEDIYQISNSLFIWMAELEVSSLCMYLYFISCLPCTHTHTHRFIYICVYIHTHTHTRVYIHMHVYVYTHTHEDNVYDYKTMWMGLSVCFRWCDLKRPF